jgi:hypothetical protein
LNHPQVEAFDGLHPEKLFRLARQSDLDPSWLVEALPGNRFRGGSKT